MPDATQQTRSNTAFDAEILARMAEGESLRAICADLKTKGCPTSGRIVQRVLADDPPGFAKQYAHAREMQCEAWADKIFEEATTARIGTKTVERPDGVEVTTGDAVDRSRLAVDALKWTLAKLHPKKYGDKVTQEISGPEGGPIVYGWGDEKPKV